jgi:holin-like protein
MRTSAKHILVLSLGMVLLAGLNMAGNLLAETLHLAVPGPVFGLFGLLLLFTVMPQLEHQLAPACDFLLQHLALFIVPAAVGLALYQPLLNAAPLAFLLVLIVSTLATGLVAALLWRRAR